MHLGLEHSQQEDSTSWQVRDSMNPSLDLVVELFALAHLPQAARFVWDPGSARGLEDN